MLFLKLLILSFELLILAPDQSIMHIPTHRSLLVLLLFFVVFTACSKDDEPTPSIPDAVSDFKDNVVLDIHHVWGSDQIDFITGEAYLHAGTGDEMTLFTYDYYISNIELIKADGSIWAEEESYHFIKLSQGQNTLPLEIKQVPAGKYQGISYVIGVDSLRNVSGSQRGALDPVNLMFWSWNTGYIFIKAEGQSPNTASGNFSFHVGGFSGQHNALRENTHSFDGATLEVKEAHEPSITLVNRVDHLWFDNVNLVERDGVHTSGAVAAQLASNFSMGFRFDHLHQ
jgi:hypothetical protein